MFVFEIVDGGYQLIELTRSGSKPCGWVMSLSFASSLVDVASEVRRLCMARSARLRDARFVVGEHGLTLVGKVEVLK